MNSRALCLAAAVLLSPASGLAGQSVSAQARTRILVALSVTKNADLDMGMYNPGAGTVSVAATSPNAGKFTASGSASTAITVTYPTTITISNGAATLSLTTTIRGAQDDNQAGSTVVGSGEVVILSGTGRHYFWLGGTTTIGAGASTGTYTGSLTLSLQY